MEEILWQQFAENHENAYSNIYIFYFKKLYNYGRKFSQDDNLIEDTVQESLTIIWEKKSYILSAKNPKSYLFKTFRNALIYKLSSVAKSNKLFNVETDIEFDPEAIIIKTEKEIQQKTQLHRAIGQLTSRQREAIFLKFYEGLSYAQVADILNINTHGSEKLISRAIIQLRKHLIDFY